MITEIVPVDSQSLTHLKQQWGRWVLITSVVWVGLGLLISLSGQELWVYFLTSAPVLFWQFGRLWKFLPFNRTKPQEPLRYGFGAANWITLIRGSMFAFLAGFVLLPKFENWLAWLPAGLYLTAVLLDYIDGAVARLTHTTSILGEKLDMDMDGLGILIATLVALNMGQVPLVFLLVGLARYLFLIGIWIRKQKHLPVYDLPLRRFRRGLAGAQMGFLAVVLFPIFNPPATYISAYFFLTPFVLFFLLDFLAVSGWSTEKKSHIWVEFKNWVFVLRFLLASVGLVLLLLFPTRPLFQLILFSACILLVLTGTAARIAALGLMLFAGFALRVNPLDPWQWALLLLSLMVFWLGSGRFSIWQPENFILYQRIGAAPDEG
ncbi:MAG: hypothetical protein CL609_01325 [Anaerolineaceae bacterium]|nr:hypothetical protein [Anaerolineaceae bacterium]